MVTVTAQVTAVAQVWPLAQEVPHAVSVAKNKKSTKSKERVTVGWIPKSVWNKRWDPWAVDWIRANHYETHFTIMYLQHSNHTHHWLLRQFITFSKKTWYRKYCYNILRGISKPYHIIIWVLRDWRNLGRKQQILHVKPLKYWCNITLINILIKRRRI